MVVVVDDGFGFLHPSPRAGNFVIHPQPLAIDVALRIAKMESRQQPHVAKIEYR